MSGFWAKVAAGQPAPPVPAQSPAAAPPVRPMGPPWMLQYGAPYPQQQAPGAVPQQQPYGQQPPVMDQEQAHILAAQQKAQSARRTETCPSCMSGNYGQPLGLPNAMPQCYECGFNPRFQQQAAGISASGGEGPATPAKQVSTANNFNPQQIVATVG